MKSNHKIISLLLASSLLAASFAGCGKAENGENGGTDKKTEATVTFSFWGNKDEIALKQKLIKDFSKAKPDIKIKETYTDGGTYPQKLQTWFSSNTAPDVISMANDIMYDYAKQDVFEDLKPYFEKDNLNDAWNPKILKMFDFEGKVLAAPYLLKTYTVAYNKMIFDAAGVTYPTNDWTEEEFVELSKKLTKGEGMEKTFGVNLSWFPNNISKNLYGDSAIYDVAGKKMTVKDNAKYKHALTMFSDIVKNGYSPSDNEAKSLGGGFETGKFAMSVCATWDMLTWEKLIAKTFDWDVVTLPTSSENGAWTNTVHADAITMSSASKNKDAAWEVIKWHCADPDAQKISSDIGVPALFQYATSEDYLNYYPESYAVKYNKKAFVDMQERAVPWETSGIWAKVNDEVNKQYASIVLGKTTVEEAIAVMDEKGTEFLSK